MVSVVMRISFREATIDGATAARQSLTRRFFLAAIHLPGLCVFSVIIVTALAHLYMSYITFL